MSRVLIGNVKGPKGDKGDKGDPGATGATGPAGPNTVPTNQAIADAVSVEGPAKAALSAQFVARAGVGEVWAMGDSITRQGYTAPTSTVGPILGGRSYLNWASILSDGRIRFGGIAATSGATPAQIRAAHLATVIAARPRYCVVLAGTNKGTSDAQDRADLLAMWTELEAAGITPIVATLPAQSSSGFTRTTANIQALNAWITRQAQLHNYPLADFYAATVDATTGSVRAGLLYDSLHPNGTGAKLLGQAVADAVGDTLPLPPLALSNVWANLTNAVPSNALNQTWGTGRATGWAFSGTGATVAQVAMTDDEGPGYWQELTPGTGAAYLITQSQLTLVAGHRMAIGFRIKTDGMDAVGSFLGVRLYGAQGVAWWFDFEQADIDLGTMYIEVPVLTSTTTANLRIDATIGKVSVGQVTCVDLTALGID